MIIRLTCKGHQHNQNGHTQRCCSVLTQIYKSRQGVSSLIQNVVIQQKWWNYYFEKLIFFRLTQNLVSNKYKFFFTVLPFILQYLIPINCEGSQTISDMTLFNNSDYSSSHLVRTDQCMVSMTLYFLHQRFSSTV